LVGTTDHKTVPTLRPAPPEAEILWLLNECAKYLNPELKVRRQDVMSSWAGIRPLVKDPNADPEHTASASRDHVVSHDSKTDLVFVSGGKWTTYREM
jgi:glycerol-3-phosphate dehydrogenase